MPPVALWIIDDTEHHHAVAAATVAGDDRFVLTGFTSGSDAVSAYLMARRDAPQTLPRIVLMDFYLGGERGDAVTAELREFQAIGHPLTVVGYSSLRDGSQRIVDAGGDCIVPKRTDADGRNHALRRWLDAWAAAHGSGR